VRKEEFPIVDKLVRDRINEVLDKIRAEAIRFKQKLDEKLKMWEVIDERNVSVLSQDSKEVHRTQGSLL
jgi:hypothetical protein